MAQQIIDTTTNNGSYTGDPAKTAFDKVNDNFTECYTNIASAQSAATSAQTTANAAQSTASAALPASGGVVYGSFGVSGRPNFGTQGAYLGWNDVISGGMQLTCNRGTGDGGLSFYCVNEDNTQVIGQFKISGTGLLMNQLTPYSDNAYTLGSSTNRWSQLFAATATINTSDENTKTDITGTVLGLNFVLSLRPVSYRQKVRGNEVETVVTGTKTEGGVTYNVTEEKVTPLAGKRYHQGLLAQDVAAALTSAGVAPSDCGIWTQDDPADASSRQGLRYEELIAPLIKAVQEQHSLIATLTGRVAALEHVEGSTAA